MKFVCAFLVTALLCTAWSCKPKDKAPAAPEKPAAPTPVPPAPTPAPAPADPSKTTPQPKPPVPITLKLGDKISIDPVKAATWIQGAPPESFEPGHVYIFEAWATWCGPCIQSIPHLNELHKKYYDKGLRIYGMNVYEADQEKVSAFVKGRSEEMTYPVAFTGKDSPFDKEWLKASGVIGIPNTVVVIDGVFVSKTNPGVLSDQVIEKLLEGGKEAATVLNKINLANNQQEAIHITMRKFRNAMKKGDVATMEAMAVEFEKLDPNGSQIIQMKVDILLAKKDWAQVEATLIKPPTSLAEAASISMIGTRLALSGKDEGAPPPELLSKAAQVIEKVVSNNPRSNPMDWISLSSLQLKTGSADAAKQSARSAIEAAQKIPAGSGLPTEVFEKFAAEIDAGRLPTMDDFSKWIQESLRKPKTKSAPPAAPPATPEK